MSDNAHNPATEEDHTGPIKTPKQLLLTVFFAFVAPILIIAGLVLFVVSSNRPSGSAQGESMALYGVSKDTLDRDVDERLRKVGSIEIRDANRPLVDGETVFKTQCAACHGTPGIPTAPHLNDAAAWGPRIGQGYDTLLQHALKGFNAMTAQGGGNYNDVEIGRAVVHMANSGGAKFEVPEPPPAAEGAK
jgi:cytochrome c5